MDRDSKEKIKTIDYLLRKYPDIPENSRKKILLCRKMYEGDVNALIKLSILTGMMNSEEYYDDDDNNTRS